MSNAISHTMRADGPRPGTRGGRSDASRKPDVVRKPDGSAVAGAPRSPSAGMRTALYVPWIRLHGDVLLHQVFDASPAVRLESFPIVPEGDERRRRALIHFAARLPGVFARMVERDLRARGSQVDVIVLTLDWVAPMRVLARVAQDLGIPVVVMPHEAVFFDADRFYCNRLDGACVPIADLFLCWGSSQRDVIVARGFPAERVRVVTSPKLEGARRYDAQLTRAEYAARLGLDASRPIVLFAGQTLDNVADMPGARARQVEALVDASAATRALGQQLLIRMPPVDHSGAMERGIDERLAELGHPVVTYDPDRVETHPREALRHCECVVSISSTMLLEKALMDGPSLALDYIGETSPFITRGGLPAARSRDEIEARLRELVGRGTHAFPPEGWQRMAHDYSDGGFGRVDPHVAIVDEITGLPRPGPLPAPRRGARERLRAGLDRAARSAFEMVFDLPFGRQALGYLLPIGRRDVVERLRRPERGAEGGSRA